MLGRIRLNKQRLMEDGAPPLVELQISVGTDLRVVENTSSPPFHFQSFRGSNSFVLQHATLPGGTLCNGLV